MDTSRRIAVAALLLLTPARLAGAAAPAPPSALAHEKNGAKAYKLGDFRKAIEEFRASYDLAPAPILLFNLAQAHRQLGEYEKAVFFYKQYLADAPETSRFRPVAEEKVAELERVLRQNREARQSPPDGTAESAQDKAATAKKLTEPPTAAAPASPAKAAPPLPTAHPIVAVTPAATAEPAPAASPAPRSMLWRAGVGLSITGALVLVAGGALFAAGAASYSDANDRSSLSQRNEQRATAEIQQIAGAVVLGIGAAALAAGIVLATRPTRERRALTFWLAPAVGGFTVAGEF